MTEEMKRICREFLEELAKREPDDYRALLAWNFYGVASDGEVEAARKWLGELRKRNVLDAARD